MRKQADMQEAGNISMEVALDRGQPTEPISVMYEPSICLFARLFPLA